MAGLDIHYRGSPRGQPRFELYDGSELDTYPRSMLVLSAEKASPIGLTSLRNAMREADTWEARTLYFERMPKDFRGVVDFGFRVDVRLDLSDDGRGILIAIGTDELPDRPDDATIRRVLAPLLARNRCSDVSFGPDPAVNGERVVGRFAVPTRNRTVGDALRVGDQAWALITALDGGRLTLESTVGLLRTGFAHSLVDQPEGPWFDAKRAPYRTSEETHKFELAKDVAAFANTADGGMIVIGARTRRTDDADIVTAITDVALNLIKPSSYRQIIADRVHPQVEGLDIGLVERADGRGVAYIHVPAQRSELQPFVVKGAIVDGKVSAKFVSLPERVGEDTRHASIAEIHSLLQAGRVALRGAQDTEKHTIARARRRSGA